ncbi:4Fe-4S dicluster domain-containing protein [bacterium]|nr:4Fe-4S dicluster domain-containing protein [bacterium]
MKVATKKELFDCLSGMKVFAPVGKNLRFAEVSSADEIASPESIPLSPKEAFVPQDETLFFYDNPEDPTSIVEPEIDEKPFVVWGMHPCDAKAMELIGKVYTEGSYTDGYFVRRYNASVKVVIGCPVPHPGCFCGSFEGMGPFSKSGSDIFLIPLDDERFLVEGTTEKGENLIASLPDATDEDIAKGEAQKKKGEDAIDRSVPTENIENSMQALFDSEEFWEDIYHRCMGCGMCTYVCPSCYCFDIQDERIGNKYRRYRVWDSCQFGLFTLEASGHNPRPTQKERIRQRMMHKLSFFKLRYGDEHLCVGCGRCVAICPVGIDIRDVAKRAEALAK